MHNSSESSEMLLAFKTDGAPVKGEQNKSYYEITFDDACRNVAVFGGTGSGKTKGVVLPALERLVESGGPGLVLDVKGELHGFLDEKYDLTSDRFYWIHPNSRAESVNILSGLNEERFGSFIQESMNTTIKGDNKIFAERGVQMLKFVFRAVRTIEQRQPTIDELFDYMNQPDKFCRYLSEKLGGKEQLPPRFEKLINSMITLKDSPDEGHILYQGGFFKRKGNEEKMMQQYMYYTAEINAQLNGYIQDERLNRTICSKESMDLQTILFEENKILVLELNKNVFGKPAVKAQQLLRTQFQQAIINERQQSKGRKKKSFMVIDDYQQFVDVSADNNTGTIDDNHWFDTSRDMNHINVIATQSITSLLGMADRHDGSKVKTLLQNLRNLIFLPSNDPETIGFADYLKSGPRKSILDVSEEEEGAPGDVVKTKVKSEDEPEGHPENKSETNKRSLEDRLLRPRRKGQGFLYMSSAKTNEKGGSLVGDIQTGEVLGFPHMGRYISWESERTITFDSDEEMAEEEVEKNSEIFNPFGSRISRVRRDYQKEREELSEESSVGEDLVPGPEDNKESETESEFVEENGETEREEQCEDQED